MKKLWILFVLAQCIIFTTVNTTYAEETIQVEMLNKLEKERMVYNPTIVEIEVGDTVNVVQGPFAGYEGIVDVVETDKGKLKVLVMALKEIVEELESEVYSDVEAYKDMQVSVSKNRDYDEMYDDGCD